MSITDPRLWTRVVAFCYGKAYGEACNGHGRSKSVASSRGKKAEAALAVDKRFYGRTPHAYQSLIQRLDPSDSQQDEVRAMSMTKEKNRMYGERVCSGEYKVGQPDASRRILFGVPCMMHVTTLPGQLKVLVG